MLVSLLVVFNGFLVISLAAPPTEHNSKTFRNALNQQGLQTILQSIEERLRNLDQIYSVRYASPNINTDQFIRKIEILENKLSRMESQMEGRLEKISENMSSKNFKDDIAKDQLFRKIDSVYERINHKLSYVEGKIDMDILKLQTKIEAGISKIERLDHSFSVRQADMEAEVSDAVEMMESVKNNVANIENKLMNITKNTIENTFDKQTNLIHTKLDNVTNLITQIDMKVNNSLEQCYQKDVLNDFTTKDTHLTKTFKGYEDQIQNYGNKVSNMYNELWKKSTTIENTMKHSALLMNLTRKDIEELKKAGHKFTTYDSQNDGQLEIIVDSFTNTIQRKFAELGRKLESNIESVIQLQNLFLESCHRIQVDESQLENKISLVLEKLLDAVTNRSINTFKEIQSMEELIKSHDTNVYRTLNQNTNTIIKLSEKTSEDRKKLEKILSTIKKDIGNALETIQNEISSEDQENNQKFDTVASILLELQEQVNDLDSRVNEDNINYNAKQILQDILLVTKSLPDNDKLNTTILHNVEDLSKLMSRIYHLLTSIDTKINISYTGFQPGVNNHQVHQDIINNNTKDQANITNISGQENGRDNTSAEVTEPVHVVLEILPEENDNITKNSSLSRFNYTLITDNTKNALPGYDEEINEYMPVTSPERSTESIRKKDNGIIINANTDIPQASTITNTQYSQYYLNYIKITPETPGVIIKQNNFKTKNKDYHINGNSDIPATVTEKHKSKKDNIEIIDISEHSIKQNNFQTETNNKYEEDGIVINGTPSILTPTVTEKYITNLKTKKDNIETIDMTGYITKQNNFERETNNKYEDFSAIIINGTPEPETVKHIAINEDELISSKPTLSKNEENISNTASAMLDIINTDKIYTTDTPEYSINDTNSKPKYTPSESVASAEMKEDIGLKGFSSSTGENKNENNGVIINGNVQSIVTEPAENIATEFPAVSNNKNFSDVSAGSTIADIPVSDITIKSIKIESATKGTTEIFADALDEALESATAHAQNSFEYTDLKNNTNDEYIRDEYEWDYED